MIGIDRILREADVAKASLYSLFGSKDALVVAYLEELDTQWREDWTARTHALTDPLSKVLAFFDQAIEEQPGQNFRGSHFQNAAAEYPVPEADSEKQILAAAAAHQEWLRTTITELLTQRNGYPSDVQAQQVLVLFDGGLVGARLNHSVRPLEIARDMVRGMFSQPVADYSI